jgi:hypothetical protein
LTKSVQALHKKQKKLPISVESFSARRIISHIVDTLRYLE